MHDKINFVYIYINRYRKETNYFFNLINIYFYWKMLRGNYFKEFFKILILETI